MYDWRDISYDYLVRTLENGAFTDALVNLLHPDCLVVCQFIADYVFRFGASPSPTHLRERFNVDLNRANTRHISDNEIKHLLLVEKTRFSVQGVIGELQSILTDRSRSSKPADFLEPLSKLRQQIEQHTEEKVYRLSDFGEALSFYMTGKGNTRVADYGFKSFDSITGGVSAGQFIVLFANTSEGKSTLARTIAGNMAMQGKRVLYVSLEESGRKSVVKTLSTILQTSAGDIITNKLSVEAHRKLCGFGGVPGDVIFIDDVQSRTTDELKRLVDRYGAEVLILDQIPLFTPGYSNKWEDVGEVSRRLKSLAQSYPIPVIGLTQATRKAKSQRVPTIEDAMAFAYALGQDADVLIFLHPDEKYPEYVCKRCTFLKVRDFERGQTVELMWKISQGIIYEMEGQPARFVTDNVSSEFSSSMEGVVL